MKVLLTGADGLLGSNIVRELLDRKYEVRTLIQPGRKVSTLDGLSVESFEGDILDTGSIEKAITGMDYVIHAAANTSINPSRNKKVREVNIVGTQNMVEACKKEKIKRLVYVSTANSFGFGSKENPGNEEQSYLGKKYCLDYMDSKKEAHDIVINAVKEGLPAVVVNPTFMIGPYDSMPSSGAMIVAVYKKSLPGYSPGGKNYIYVKDAAVGITNALTMGRVGECYIIGNKNMNYKEAFEMIANVIGVKPPTLKLPGFVILAYGYLGTVWSKLSGKPPLVTYSMAQVSCDNHYFTAEKAVRELQLPQTPIEVAIEEAFNWLKDNNYLN